MTKPTALALVIFITLLACASPEESRELSAAEIYQEKCSSLDEFKLIVGDISTELEAECLELYVEAFVDGGALSDSVIVDTNE